jgi:hypothetical protein
VIIEIRRIQEKQGGKKEEEVVYVSGGFPNSCVLHRFRTPSGYCPG